MPWPYVKATKLSREEKESHKSKYLSKINETVEGQIVMPWSCEGKNKKAMVLYWSNEIVKGRTGNPCTKIRMWKQWNWREEYKSHEAVKRRPEKSWLNMK